MTNDQIKEYALLYDISQPLSFEELPKTTSGNISYIIDTPNKQYVLRVLVRQGIESANNEHVIQALLDNAGVKAPLYIQSIRGNIVETINNTSIVISEFIPGSRQPEDTIELAKSMGSMLAKIHNILSTTHILFTEQQWFNPRNTKTQLERYTGPEKSSLQKKPKNILIS